MDLLNGNFKTQKDKQKPNISQKSDFEKSQNSGKWGKESAEKQEADVAPKKTFKNLKGVPLNQFALADMLFLKRELEFDQIKSNLYQVLDMNKDDDETKILKSVIHSFRSIS